MGKLSKVNNGYVSLTLDKLPGIRADLVRLDDDWHEWKFFHFLEALRKWCEKNPNASSDLPNYSQYRPQGVGQGKLQGEKGLSMQGKNHQIKNLCLLQVRQTQICRL